MSRFGGVKFCDVACADHIKVVGAQKGFGDVGAALPADDGKAVLEHLPICVGEIVKQFNSGKTQTIGRAWKPEGRRGGEVVQCSSHACTVATEC